MGDRERMGRGSDCDYVGGSAPARTLPSSAQAPVVLRQALSPTPIRAAAHGESRVRALPHAMPTGSRGYRGTARAVASQWPSYARQVTSIANGSAVATATVSPVHVSSTSVNPT